MLLMLTLMGVVGGAQRHAPCSEHAHRRMQEQFTACRSAHARAYHDGGRVAQSTMKSDFVT
jgi:hypothetical protein